MSFRFFYIVNYKRLSLCFRSEPRRQSDVSSLICALNTTLRLSDVNNDRESPDVETAPEKTEEPMDVPYGAYLNLLSL